MKGFFSYHWTATGGKMDLRALTLFKTPGTVAPEDIAAIVEESAKSHTQPDVILIQYFWYDTAWLDALESSDRIQEIKERLGSSTSVLLVKCEKNGKCDVIALNKGFSNLVPIIKPQIASSKNAGLTQLFDPRIVVSIAPKGFAFRKPSGDHSTFFIHAQNALTDSDHVAFLAYCLLPSLALRSVKSGRPIHTIYVDSMSIASLAFTIKEIYQKIEPLANPRIVSFHSHEGMKQTPKPLRGQSLCLISASSSMRLQGDWLDYSKCDVDEVITLITFDDAKNKEGALFRLKAKDKGSQIDPIEMVGEVQIFGENFSASQIHPKRVELFKASGDTDATSFSQQVAKDDVLFLDRLQKSGTKKRRGIFVDGAKLFELDPFKEWLKDRLKNGLPPRLRAIIYQEDEDSKILAEKIVVILKEFSTHEIPIYPHTSIRNSLGASAFDEGLLIVAGQIGNGTALLSLSRDLRGLHNGPRQYLVGVQFSKQRADIISLKKNIEFSSLKANICLNVYKTCALGPHLEISFESDRRFLKQIRGLAGVSRPSSQIFANTIDATVSRKFVRGNLELNSDLILRKDFAFWDKNSYREGEVNQSAVILTVAGMLQRAREDEALATPLRLSQAAIGAVILDPANFSRYNDGLIQTAILRCASPAELDYTCQVESSQQIKNFLIKIVEHIEDDFGEAALEFLLALATYRLSIRSEHLAELQKIIKNKSAELKQSSTGKVLKIFAVLFEPRVAM